MNTRLILLLTVLLAACSPDAPPSESAAHASTETEAETHGRTTIPNPIAADAGVTTALAGPEVMRETLPLYGRIAANAERQREVRARFPGLIQRVAKQQGDAVKAGEVLATIESNDSLQTYALTAPIAGIVTQRDANAGEQSGERTLFTLTDTGSVWAKLSVFPRDRARIGIGAVVTVRAADGGVSLSGNISRIDVQAGSNQSVIARVVLDNRDAALPPGSFVTAEVTLSEHTVPLAVKTAALQRIGGAEGVFEQIGETYEARPLTFGRRQGEWTEVVGGLAVGARYVVANSYLIKADLEKSGASHEH